MSGEPHVDHLFSAAYDRGLANGDEEAFSRHVAGCSRCAQEFEGFVTSINGLRALPTRNMPTRVHIPFGVPGSGREPLMARLLRRLRGPQVIGGAAAVMAVGAAVAGAIFFRGATGTSPRTTSAVPPPAAGLAAPARPDQGTSRCASPVTSPTVGGGSALSAAAFSNRAVIIDPFHPQQTLVLATTGVHFARGAHVPVLAQVVPRADPAAAPAPDATPGAVTPCVTLSRPPQPHAAVGQNRAAEPQQVPTTGAAPPPVADAPLPGVPVDQLTVPSDVPPGTVLHVDAAVPGGAPGSPPLHAQIDIVAD